MVQQRPIVLGIVGDSAAGKTTLAHGLRDLLGHERVTHVRADDYHRYDREERARLGITALHPDCNYLDILELHLERLHYGQPILKPVYDHSNGTLVRPAYVRPREFVIVEGLLGCHTPVMRQFYDVRVYLDPAEDVRRIWKLERDTARRGYRTEEVLEELGRRERDAREFIRPQREHADVVVRFYARAGMSPEEAGPNLSVRLVLRPTIPHPDLSAMFDGVPAPASGVRLQLGRDGGRPVDVLEIDGNVTPEQAAQLEAAVWRHLPGLRPLPAEQFGRYVDRGEMRHSDPLALTELLLLYHLLREHTGLARHRYARPVAALSRLHVPSEGVEMVE
jgi:phosphoribulokinase